MPATRRPHQKSRAGCISCKERKIKCDELKPSCRYCTSHSYKCTYPLAASTSQAPRSKPSGRDHISFREPPAYSPSTPLSPHTPFGGWNTKDFELLHFYTTSTCFTFSVISERRQVWQHVIPQIAFSDGAGFLLHGVLAISALHLSRLEPDRKASLISDASVHHMAALPMFRSTLSNINPQNCHACFAFGALLCMYKWASVNDTAGLFFSDTKNQADSDNIEWIHLLRGAASLTRCYYQEITKGPLRPLSKWDSTAELSAGLDPEDPAKFTDLEALVDAESTLYSAPEMDALKVALKWLKVTYTMVSRPDYKIDAASTALSWPVRVPDLFLTMVNKRQPKALVLLGHYCLLLNRVEDFWWIHGMSRRLLQTILQKVGKEWEAHLSWPLQDLVLCEFKNQHHEMALPIDSTRPRDLLE